MKDERDFPEISERLLRVLRDPGFWALRDAFEDNPREPAWARLAARRYAEVAARHAAASDLCDSMLTGPASRWPERVRNTPDARSFFVVLQLLYRVPALLERRPDDALQVTSIAMGIAEVLDPADYPTDHVLVARGQALREHAQVLSFLGRYAEALQYVERAEQVFSQTPIEELDIARLAVVKACALRMQNRSEEAIALTRKAAKVFLAYGERKRYVNARVVEAAMLYDGGAVERALEMWTSVQGDSDLDEIGAVRVEHNIALCLCDLGRHAEAVAPLEHCVAEFTRLDLPTERTRSRWHLGNALLGTGRSREAIAVLRVARREFTELGLPVDAALAALDLSEALVAVREPAEVPAICRDVIAELTEAGLAMKALPALTLLREAAAAGRASRKLIRVTRGKVRRAGRNVPQQVRGTGRGRNRLLSRAGSSLH